MKNSILTLAISFCSFTFSFSQKTFAPFGAKWNYEIIGCTNENKCIEYEVINNQTNINDNQIIILGKNITENKNLDTIIFVIQSKRVYLFKSPVKYLIYDFGQNAGDTIQLYRLFNSKMYRFKTVIETKSEFKLSDSTAYKFKCKYLKNDSVPSANYESEGNYYYEIIGTGDIMIPKIPIPEIACGGLFLTNYKDSQYYYKYNSGYNLCNKTTAIMETANEKDVSLAYLFNDNFKDCSSFVLYDYSGRLIIHTKSSSELTELLNTKFAGFYLLNLTYKNQFKHFKIIKQ